MTSWASNRLAGSADSVDDKKKTELARIKILTRKWARLKSGLGRKSRTGN
jgi:hypothetical protein